MKGKCLLQSGAKVQEDLDFNEGLFTLFSANNTYAVGNVVRYQDGLYRCHTAVAAAGPWTGDTNWAKTTVDALLGGIQSGTKLYKHTMKFEGGTVYLINNSSEVITERFGAYLAFHNANCISAKMIEGPHVYIVLNISLNGDEDETISFLTEEGETMSFPVSFKNDTVTAL